MTATCHPTDLSALVADLDHAVRSTRGNDVETLDAVCAALRPARTSASIPSRRSRSLVLPRNPNPWSAGISGRL